MYLRAALLIVIATPALAQVRTSAINLTPAAVAESLTVLRTLDAATRSNGKDAAAWHRLGMISWALSDRAENKNVPLKNLDGIRLRHQADLALVKAAELEANNAVYQSAAGRFLMSSNGSGSRAASFGYLEAAVKLARASNDKRTLAEASIELGRGYWRRYDAIAFRDASAGAMPQSLSDAGVMPGSAVTYDAESVVNGTVGAFDNLVRRSGRPMSAFGDADYAQAEQLFRDAIGSDPDNVRAFRQMAMLLAERYRWTELAIIARERAKRMPQDAWSRLALGLLLQREGKSPLAKVAFDTALTLLGENEGNRMFGLQRVVPIDEVVTFRRLPPAAREERARQFWTLADPLWSRDGNDAGTEFLARVTFAELRWTVDELYINGADTDRGDIYIRLGPPDRIATTGPDVSSQKIAEGGTTLRSHSADVPQFVVTYWTYLEGETIVFQGLRTYATAEIPPKDRGIVAIMLEKTPYRFTNVETGRVLPIVSFAARFRTPSDSVDLWIATKSPLAGLRNTLDANIRFRNDLWMFGRNIPTQYRDSVNVGESGLGAWTFRVAPSNYMYRVETTGDGVLGAAQVTQWINTGPDSGGFATRGFGLSDIVLAEHRDVTADARRWRDLTMTPLFGSARQDTRFDIVWESYEVGNRGGRADYDVAVTMERIQSRAGRLAATMLDALGGVLGAERRPDRIITKFERHVAHAPALVDRVTVALGETSPGTYRLSVQITDRATGRATNRSTTIAVR